MKLATTQQVVASDATPKSPSRATSRPGFRHPRMLLVPAFLALAGLVAACNSSPSPTAASNSLLASGLSAEKAGQAQQAVKDFNEAAKKNPTSAIPYYDLGVVYQELLQNPTQAAAEYNKALLADPNYKSAMFNLATIEATSNPTDAITLYQKLVKLNPNDANSNFNLGLLLYGHGQVSAGQAALEKAIALDPALKSRVPSGVTP
jgi:tetratricopeptide (TPR) repeat protein